MSSVNNSNGYETDNYGDYNSSETEYDSYNDEIDGASEDYSDEGFGDSSEAVDPAAAKDQLRELEKQVQTLNPEVQKMLLETIDSLELQIARLGGSIDNDFERKVFEHTLAKMSEVEGQVIGFTTNGDQLTKYVTQINELEKNLKDNKYLSTEERTAYQKQIKEIKEQLLKGEVDLSSIEESLKPFQDRLVKTEEFETEAKRTEGLGNQVAADLDKAFSGSDVDSAAWGAVLSAAGSGAVGGLVAGAMIGGAVTTGIALGTAGTFAALGLTALGPAGWGVLAGAAVLGGVINYAFTETEKPKSGLKGAPSVLQDFDVAMGKKSGLVGSPVPGELARILYRTDISGDEQLKLIQQSISKLPVGSQGMALSMVLTTLSQRDPQKLQFLAQHSPGVINFMKQTLKSNETAIKTGMIPVGEYDGYTVKFENGQYSHDNTDTSMWRNDWNDFKKDGVALAAPITNAISFLDSLSVPESAAAETEEAVGVA